LIFIDWMGVGMFGIERVMCVGVCGLAAGIAMGMHPPAESAHVSALGAGGLWFEEVYDLDGAALVEVGDLNGDGVEDLLFGFGSEKNGVGFALGAIGEDGSIGFTITDFANTSEYDALTAGDIDGDGLPEILIRRHGYSALQILRILPDVGAFSEYESIDHTEYTEYPDGFADAWVGVECGDLDGDGLDEVVYNSSQASVVIRWSSRPARTEFQVYPVPAAGSRNALYDVRDYDGDGMADVLLVNADTERFVLLKGTGADSVMIPVEVEVPVVGFVARGDVPYFGNFDGNGFVDLVLNNSDDGTSVVIADFVNSPAAVVPLGVEVGERVAGVPGDLDGSGVDELLVVGVDAESDNTRIIEEVSLLYNPLLEGSARVVIEVGNVPVIDDPDLPRLPLCAGVNFDGAGEEDLLWMGFGRRYEVSSGVNDGELLRWGAHWRTSPWRDPAGGIPAYGATQLEGQNVPSHINPADVDGDGVDELIVVGVASRAKLVDVNDGVTSNINGVNNAFVSAMADLGGNGQAEAVFAQVQNSLAIKASNGDGTFGPLVLFANPNGGNYRTLNVADFDGDGKDDVLMYDNVNSQHHLWRGTGSAQVELWSTFLPMSLGGTKIAVADISGDGLPDLINGTEDEIQFWVNEGDGSFSLETSFSVQYPPYWIETADMDQDGILDVVSVNTDDPTTVYFIDEKMGVSESIELSHGENPSGFEVVVADLDGNGLLDLIASADAGVVDPVREVRNDHLIWMQTSARDFVPGGVLPSAETNTVAVSDLNGDGVLDVATASNWDDSVRVHWGTPTGCAVDLTGEGDLNFLDISEFLSMQLDFNDDGAFNFLDISAYLQAFAAGCP
jgi:VCBS repeat protein